MMPIRAAPTGDTASQPAVIPTRPAKAPLRVIETSGFVYRTQVMIIVAVAAQAAAKVVVTEMLEAASNVSSPVMDRVDPPLNPNQQNQRMNTPKAPNVRL